MISAFRRLGASSLHALEGLRLRMLVFAMVLPMFLGSCGLILSPTHASQVSSEQIATSLVVSPTCLRVTFTYSGSSGIIATFPDRSQCVGGLVVVAGGTATRSGSGNKIANIPVRVVNLGAYAVRTPLKLVLAPAGRTVLDPVGGAASKVTPQNHDSVRASTGSWVWMIGAPTSVIAGDSTGVKTLTIKMDSPASSAQLDYTVEGQQLTAGGWPLLNGVPTNLDTLSRVVMSSGIVLLRRHLIIEFEVGVTDSAITALFSSRQIEVLSVTKAGQFFIRTLDPGGTYAQYDSMVQSLRGTPEVLLAAPMVYSGLEITLPGRYPE